jgi:hypothetical protein
LGVVSAVLLEMTLSIGIIPSIGCCRRMQVSRSQAHGVS